MKRFLAMTAILGLVAMPVLAEQIIVSPSQIHATPLTGAVVGSGGTIGSGDNALAYLNVDMSNVEGMPEGAPVMVYSNNPLLGTSSIPVSTIAGLTNTWVGVDWVGVSAAWTDRITMTQAGTITTITYLYSNTTGVSTQSIVIGTGPQIPGVSGVYTGVVAVATVVAPALPTGGVVALSITGLSIPVGTSIYTGYEDRNGVGGGTLSTFWFTGGFPLIGASLDNMAYWVPGSYTYAVQGPFLFATVAAHGNITQSIIMPEPMTIGLVAAGGLLALRRRRAA
jgi:hypothetical protein